MNDDNLIIQSLWIGNYLSPLESLCIKSYLYHGHEFHLYCYDEILNLPKGVKLKDASEILSEEEIFLDSHNSITAFSDYFRYCLLYQKGGWWVDLDTVCLNFFDFKEPYCFATERINLNAGNKVTTAYIKSPSKSEYLKESIDFIKKRKGRVVSFGIFGSSFLSKILDFYDSECFIKPPELFCPISSFEIDQFIIEDKNIEDYKNSKAIHFWNERWCVENKNKYAEFKSGCLYEKLKRKYDSGV